MKRNLLITILLLLSALLLAEGSPLDAYFDNPDAASFTAAYNFCAEQLAADSTAVSYEILMANLAAIEASRLTDGIAPKAKAFDLSGKFQFANLLLAQNRFEEAVGLYNEINAESPGWSCPWRHKGEALYNLKRYKEAEVSLKQAVETNKEHYDAYVWLAKTQYQLKKYKQALKNLETALTLNPGAEESPDETLAEDSIRALHEDLLYKTGKKE